MFSEAQYTDTEILIYSYILDQEPAQEEEKTPSYPTHVYEENSVYYCASTTQNGVYWYVYCLNPLIYTDPSGEFINYIIGGVIGGISGTIAGLAAGATGWELVGYIGVGTLAGVVTSGVSAAMTTAGYSAAAVAVGAGATGGAISGAGNAAVSGGNAGDIFSGMVRGATLGGVGGLASYGAMAALGAAANGIGNIGLGKNEPFIIPGEIVRGGQGNVGHIVTKLTGGFSNTIGDFMSQNIGSIAGMGGSIVPSASDAIKQYYVAKNGTHLSVDQYQNYKTHVDNGTAEGWMIRNYNSWSRNIGIVIPQCGVNNEFTHSPVDMYLGAYSFESQTQLEFKGSMPYDAKALISIGSSLSQSLRGGEFVPSEPLDINVKVKHISIRSSGEIYGGGPDVYLPRVRMFVIVSHRGYVK